MAKSGTHCLFRNTFWPRRKHELSVGSDGGDRRAALFRENFADTAERWALAAAWAFAPKRVSGLPALARLCLSEFLAPDYALPDPERALDDPCGLAGIAHELSLPTLMAAYRRGLYPLSHAGPQKWWSPPQAFAAVFR